MPSNHLPPHLAQSFQSLATSPQTPLHQAILHELHTVSQVLGMAIDSGISGPAMKELESVKSGITTSGVKICECCQRPF